MLRNRWYPVLETGALRKTSIGIKRFGLDLVLWRDPTGAARISPATCPHRGASLAGGRIVDGELEFDGTALGVDLERHQGMATVAYRF